MTVRIKRASVRDVTKVKPLWSLMMQSYQDVAGNDWPIRDPQEAWQRRHQDYLVWLNEAAGVLFIAWSDEGTEAQAVGYLALHFVDSDAAINLGERVGVVEALAVLPEFRERGVGASLMTACRAELERREIAYCCIETLANNEVGLRLCENHGFRSYMVRLIQRVDGDDEPDGR